MTSLLPIALRIALLAATGILISASRRNASERHLLLMLTLFAMVVLPLATVALPPIPLIPAPGVGDAGRQSVDRFAALPMLWIAGTLVCLARLGHAHVRARRLVRRAETIDVSRMIEAPVRLSGDVAFAFSYGLREPVIVLPARAAAWSEEQLRATLLHEGAHLARRDTASLLASQCAIALYWWHPAVWLVARMAAAERERACDDAVLRAGVPASDYGSHLLANAANPSPLATALMSRSDGLAGRISRLLDTRADRNKVARRNVIAAWVGAVPLIVLVAAASPLPPPTRAAEAAAPKKVQAVVRQSLPEARPAAKATSKATVSVKRRRSSRKKPEKVTSPPTPEVEVSRLAAEGSALARFGARLATFPRLFHRPRTVATSDSI